TDDRSVKHGTAPQRHSFPTRRSSDLLITLTATVTDKDGDTASATADVGSRITILDDGPLQGAIQNAIMPSVNSTDAHGTWQPTFGADGPKATAAIGITMGTAPAGETYTVTDTGTHNPAG